MITRNKYAMIDAIVESAIAASALPGYWIIYSMSNSVTLDS